MTACAAGLSQASDVQANASVRGSLLAAVAELARVAASAEHLQETLSPLLQRGGEAAEAAQVLDEVTQHLHGLGEFLSAIAQGCPPELGLDLSGVLERLRLHAQKQRLTSDRIPTDAVVPLPRSPTSGELDLW